MSARETTYQNPRAWMKWYFERNAASYRQPQAENEADWESPLVRVGAVVFRPMKDAVVCFAAEEEALARSFLARGGQLLARAVARFGNSVERDGSRLDRPTLAIVSRLGGVLSPGHFPHKWPVPFDSFGRYIGGDGAGLGEQNIADLLWALLAVLDEMPDEYRAARNLGLRAHPELKEEMNLVVALGDLTETAGGRQWAMFELVLARWLNPILKTETFASNFQDHVAALLTLVWCKYRLKRLDLESVLKTYFGETVSIPVPVK